MGMPFKMSDNIFGNGRSRGQSRGIYSGTVYEVFHPFGRFYYEISSRHRCTTPAKAVTVLEKSMEGRVVFAAFSDPVKSLSRCLGAFIGLHPVCRGAGEKVAVDRGGNKNTLSVFVGQTENGVLCLLPLGFIKQQIFSCPRELFQKAHLPQALLLYRLRRPAQLTRYLQSNC